MRKDGNSRICIIGAGAAGLSMAYYLKERGYKYITVLEKNSYVGGKCYSEKKYGQAYGMGAIAVTACYKKTIKMINKFGLNLEPSPLNVLIDSQTGYQYPLRYYFRDMNKFRLGIAIIKFLYQILIRNRSIRKTGFHSKNPDLALPFSEWLEKMGIAPLKEALCIPLTCFGYGYLHEIPALYVLKYMNFINFMTLQYLGLADMVGFKPRWTKMLINGMEQLMQALADEQNDVRLNISLYSVRRGFHDNRISVSFKSGKGGKIETLIFDYLVVTVPPTIADLNFMDLSEEERAVFDRVKLSDFYSILCEVKDMSRNFFLQLVNNRKLGIPLSGQPFMISKVWNESDLAIYYTYDNEGLSEKEIIIRLEQFVRSINRQMLKVVKLQKWKYFPHFDSGDISNGIYDRLEGIQGTNNTYYAGGLLNFEIVENVLEYSDYLVKKHF